MQRRTFIKSAALTTLGLAFQACGSSRKGSSPFYYPAVLINCTDEQGLFALGERYREQNPGERTEEVILAALSKGKDYSREADDVIEADLAKQVQQDFQEKNIVILDGWIISLTEARQCALFSLLT